MTEIFASRREKLRRAMRERGLDALLISQAANRFYLSGFELHDPQFNESAGRLVITADGRDWLATQLAQGGVQVDHVVAYQRCSPVFDPAQRSLVQTAAVDGSVWLLSSSEAVANLSVLMPGQSWNAARAVATHPRIAQRARELGFGVVCESRPILSSVVASIESFA